MMWMVVTSALAIESGTVIVGADWGGADLVVAEGDILEGTFSNVGSFVVPSDVVVAVQPEVPLEIFAASILIQGTLDGTGGGDIGGPGGGEANDGPGKSGAGDGGGRGGPITSGYGGGGGGGSHGGEGGTGGVYYAGYTPAGGGPLMGIEGGRYDPLILGSGGGGGAGYGYTVRPPEAEGGRGGRGGGAIRLVANEITVDGAVLADGLDGQEAPGYISSGGGGGSGGTIVIDGQIVDLPGTISARGGAGGSGYTKIVSIQGGGGGGGGGRIKIFYGVLSMSDDVIADPGGPGDDVYNFGSYAEESTAGDFGTVYTELTDLDVDVDGVLVPTDNCPSLANSDQVDQDGDGIGDACDDCPIDPLDSDLDGVCDSVDVCFGDDSVDTDADLQPDDCDCAPEDPHAQTNGVEVCDQFDNNCDGVVDPLGSEGELTLFLDLDGDGFGRYQDSTFACDWQIPLNYVEVGGDCNDDRKAVNPGAGEFCDGVDNDCDGIIDQLCSEADPTTGAGCTGCDSRGSGAPGILAFAGLLTMMVRRRR